MIEVHLTDRARVHIDEIERHSVQTIGAHVAERYPSDIANALRTISEHSGLLRSRDELSSALLVHGGREHTLLVQRSGDRAFIVAIWASEMDFVTRISRTQP